MVGKFFKHWHFLLLGTQRSFLFEKKCLRVRPSDSALEKSGILKSDLTEPYLPNNIVLVIEKNIFEVRADREFSASELIFVPEKHVRMPIK